MRGFELELQGARVFFVGSSFLVFPKQIYAATLTEAIEEAGKEVERLGRKLQGLFPLLRLHYRKEICREQMALCGGITKWVPKPFNFLDDRLLIDFSTGRAEVESFGQFSYEGMMNVAVFLDSVAKGDVAFVPPTIAERREIV